MSNQQNPEGSNLISGRITSFGFKESPFSYQSVVRFFYPADSRLSILKKILRQYEQCFVRMMVVGKKGAGKTHLAQTLSALLVEEQKSELKYYRPLDIPGREETLRILLDALQFDWQKDFEQSFQFLKDAFVHQAVIKKPFFLIIEQDTAHKPIHADAILHELLQLRQEGHPVFHLVWFTVEKPFGMEYLFLEDIDECINLSDMAYQEMKGMINYRCQVAGRKKSLFTTEALHQIFHLTHGNPGLTIRLCDFALDETSFERKKLCGVEELDNAWRKWIV